MGLNISKMFFEQKDHPQNDYYEEISDDQIAQEEKFGNLYRGRNVVWIGQNGRMIQALPDYTYPIDGNIFYDDKIQTVESIIQDSNDYVYFYAPYGEASIITLNDVAESIQYEGDISHRAWTTGDEDLDEYVANELDWIEWNFEPESSIFTEDLLKFVKSNNLDDFKKFLIEDEGWDEEDFEEGFEDAVTDLSSLRNLINEMETLKKEAVQSNSGDLGKISVQIRDGNHRAFGAFAAGEPYVWVMLSDNQMQDINQGETHVSALSNMVESIVLGNINNYLIEEISEQLRRGGLGSKVNSTIRELELAYERGGPEMLMSMVDALELKQLSDIGSQRVVYDIDGDHVLKFARHDLGKEANEREASPQVQSALSGLVPKVYWRSKDNSAVIMDKVIPASSIGDADQAMSKWFSDLGMEIPEGKSWNQYQVLIYFLARTYDFDDVTFYENIKKYKPIIGLSDEEIKEIIESNLAISFMKVVKEFGSGFLRVLKDIGINNVGWTKDGDPVILDWG